MRMRRGPVPAEEMRVHRPVSVTQVLVPWRPDAVAQVMIHRRPRGPQMLVPVVLVGAPVDLVREEVNGRCDVAVARRRMKMAMVAVTMGADHHARNADADMHIDICPRGRGKQAGCKSEAEHHDSLHGKPLFGHSPYCDR